MLIVTHEMQFAEDISDRVIFMDHGQIVEQGPPHEMFRSPAHTRTQAFLRAVIDRQVYAERPPHERRAVGALRCAVSYLLESCCSGVEMTVIVTLGGFVVAA